MPLTTTDVLDRLKQRYPDKFLGEHEVFSHIRRGDRIFLGTACGEPQHLVHALTDYVKTHPKAFFDAELIQVWTLGVAPYTDERLKSNLRLNAFFIGNNTRAAINSGLADYTPIFLSQVPDLFRRRLIAIDVALIQTSLPDSHGFLSLGVSVDIVKAAAASAAIVVAQVNPQMPRVHGDGFVHISEVDYLVPFDEPLLEYRPNVPDEIATRIGKYVARIVEDGDTIQVGYGRVPNAIMSALGKKKRLGVHTELLTDGMVDLIRQGVIDNSRKTVNRGKTVTSFCMGSRSTYDFLDGNPALEFRTIDYTNSPLVIAQHENMCAINSVLEIDLTGQATAESIGHSFYSGIGGQADFMRGAVLAKGGKSILVIQSTAQNGSVSRIVPFLREGAGATLNRGDVHYIVTEFGIAHIHGKNVRERAMDLIGIAHPAFRHQLVEEARRLKLIYGDQVFVPGERGEYPEHLEARKATKTGLQLLLRPVKISDEPLVKDFFYSLSDQSMYRRFMTPRRDMPHERLQEFVAIDYTRGMVILACLDEGARSPVVGLAEYYMEEDGLSANVAFAVRDQHQNKGVGTALLAHLTQIARKQGLLGFTAEVLRENEAMLRVFEKMKFPIETSTAGDVYRLKISLK
ncbi:MAG TPA: GNAT family N-acetyltransferase [Vicinamibacterales bacterium]|jgi:acyl-CoA hydrolase/GNAT superfamily N-acetyltransferase